MVYGDDPDERVKTIPTEKSSQYRFCINDERVMQLAKWVMQIEELLQQSERQMVPDGCGMGG